MTTNTSPSVSERAQLARKGKEDDTRYSDAALTPPVDVIEDYTGPVTVMTCTVMFDRAGAPESGAVICTGAHGERVAAAVHDRDTLELLTDGSEPVGTGGTVTVGDLPEFRA